MNVEFYVEETKFKQFGIEFTTDKYVTPLEWCYVENEISILIGQYFKDNIKSGSVQLQSTAINLTYSVLPASRCKVKIPINSRFFMKVLVNNCMYQEVQQKADKLSITIDVLRSSTRSTTRNSVRSMDSNKIIPKFIEERKKMAENQTIHKIIVNKLVLRKTNSPQNIKETQTQKQELFILHPKKSNSPLIEKLQPIKLKSTQIIKEKQIQEHELSKLQTRPSFNELIEMEQESSNNIIKTNPIKINPMIKIKREIL